MNEATARRFWDKVKKTDHCWLWQAAKSGGYGRFWFGGRVQKAHRVAYETLIGKIPGELEIDHLCRQPACVNPEHLEPVSHRENVRRGLSPLLTSLRAKAITHCPRGHLYAGDNVHFQVAGTRRCRVCDREKARDRRRKKSAKAGIERILH